MQRADILKASTDDLAYLVPGAPPAKAAGTLLDRGAALVIVTDGPRPASAFLQSGREIRVDVPPVEVADTIGAGDAFGGAFLARWTGHGMTRPHLDEPDAIRDALAFAVQAAALACTRPGAEPPYLAELTAARRSGPAGTG
jgi:fructokinase